MAFVIEAEAFESSQSTAGTYSGVPCSRLSEMSCIGMNAESDAISLLCRIKYEHRSWKKIMLEALRTRFVAHAFPHDTHSAYVHED